MIKPMLAQDFHKDLSQRKIKKYEEDYEGDLDYKNLYSVQPKLDGIRVIADLATGNLYKRSGVEVKNCPHINRDMLELGFAIPGFQFVDGELYNHQLEFSEINSYVSRTVNILDTECIQLHLFDMDGEDSFQNRNWILQKAIKDLRNKIFESSIYPVETFNCENMDDVFVKHKTFMENGYEGTMLRLNHLPYEHKRSNQLYKIKDFQDEEFRIIGWNEEENHPGYLGSFDVADNVGNCFAVRPAVTRGVRKEYWEDKENLIDCYLTVRYQEKSKDGIPRFPIGVDIRYDLNRKPLKKKDYKPTIPICDTSFHRGW